MASRRVKALVKRTVLYRILDAIRTALRYRREYRVWVRSGRPVPVPHLAKQLVIREYAKRFGTRVLIETGTYRGDMVHALRTVFRRIYSIELSDELSGSAKRRFAGQDHISIISGDSAHLLPNLLTEIDEPCLFWLDGHYSGGMTALGREKTPILHELRHITAHPNERHVILIDDARCFTGEDGWPSLAALQELIHTQRPDWDFAVRDDIIRTYRPVNPPRR